MGSTVAPQQNGFFVLSKSAIDCEPIDAEAPSGPARSTTVHPQKALRGRNSLSSDAAFRNLYHGLLKLLDHAAARYEADVPPFDVRALGEVFSQRARGYELNLHDLKPAESQALVAVLSKLDSSDWSALFEESSTGRKRSFITHLEIDADLLPHFLRALGDSCSLDVSSLHVWAPDEGGPMDFGSLQGMGTSLRINIPGSPSKPLQIQVREGTVVEARDEWCPAIQQSTVTALDDDGKVVSMLPLATRQPDAYSPARVLPGDSRTASRTAFTEKARSMLPPATRQPDALSTARPLPCVNDTALRATLTEKLRNMSGIGNLKEANVVAAALMACAELSGSDEFGFNLRRLSAEQLGHVLNLPPGAWAAIQTSARRSCSEIAWIQAPNDFDIQLLARAFGSLRPLPRVVGRPCADDSVLLDSLEQHLRDVCALTEFAGETFDVPTVARAISLCGCLNNKGAFGFDFTRLEPSQANIARHLPQAAWAALAECAARKSMDIDWVTLHDDFGMSEPMQSALKQLTPTSLLSASAPAVGLILSFRIFCGDVAAPAEIEIRPRPNNKFIVVVPDTIVVRLPDSAAQSTRGAIQDSKVRTLNRYGKELNTVPILKYLGEEHTNV